MQIEIINKPLLLERRADLYERFIDLSRKHLKPVHTDKFQLEVKDSSGKSNPVFIVNVKDCNNVNNKIVIKFFESHAADVAMENLVFSIASQQGYAPAMIYLENLSFRVEEVYPGIDFTTSELRNHEVVERCTKLMCDFNYDSKMLEIRQSPLSCNEVINNQKKGWYWQAKNEVLPLYEEIRRRLNPNTEIYKKAFKIIDELEELIFKQHN